MKQLVPWHKDKWVYLGLALGLIINRFFKYPIEYDLAAGGILIVYFVYKKTCKSA